MTRPRVAFLTFGCRANQYETDCMRALLAPSCDVVEDNADIYIVNGCSVTALAEKKARQALQRLRRSSPHAVIVATGCLGEAIERRLSPLAEADVIAGNSWKPRIAALVAEAVAGRRGVLAAARPADLDVDASMGPAGRIRANLRVQDGCGGACTYCRAVQLRGPSRSKTVAAATSEARRLIAAGFPEIVLTGVNLAEYEAPEGDLPALTRSLLALPELARLRLASINVPGIDGPLLDVFAQDPRFCRHFHIPLQTGDDRVLTAMGRSYSARGYLELVARIRTRLPDATFGSDVIVGFPGEDDAAFAATCRVVSEVGFSNLHIFRFSPRRGTSAATLANPVPEAVKRERARALAMLWERELASLLDDRIGGTEDVLIEAGGDGQFRGHTAGYIEVAFSSAEPLREGELCRVRVTGVDGRGLRGVHDG